MKLRAKQVATFVIVGFGLVAGRGAAAQDVAAAPGPKPIIITRIFTGADGLSHAEDIELKLGPRGVADMLKATGAEFSRRPPTPGADPHNTAASPADSKEWHTGPARQFVITLTGNSEVEVSGGVHVAAGPGHINLIEDTTGKGHITRNFGPDDRVVVTIPLGDGVVVEGKATPRTK
jgi:hypothetical protein